MTGYILKRLLQTVVVLWGVSVVTFILMNIVPGDPVLLMLEKRATPEAVERVRREMGLDRPKIAQYAGFLSRAVRLDLGRSYFTRAPVMATLTRRFGVTLRLASSAYAAALVLGVSAGVAAALKRGRAFDSIVTGCSVLGISAPVFWIAIILQMIFGLRLGWLPISGVHSPGSFVLPAAALGAHYMASISRLTRTSVLEAISQDYIRTARAKGLAERAVVLRHALRNALIPIVTLSGAELGNLLAGSMLTEWVFAIPGIGKLMVDSILMRDLPMLQGTVLYVAVVFVLTNLAVDISYAFIDPRVRYGGGERRH
ncbi:MAG: ABC transporter permease [Synergistaceae bacterium]|jgi:peptide/nickel transport system permease protein|nr:ABC transporter permease [Synergistaceae bacterium]